MPQNIARVWGLAVGQFAEALRHKTVGPGFDSRWVFSKFSTDLNFLSALASRWQYGVYALHAGQVRLHARVRARTRTKYVILLFHGSNEHASLLRYTYIACLVNYHLRFFTGRNLTSRYKEHVRYTRQNQTSSAYAMHILNNNHCNKSTTMNCWEDLFIQQYRKENKLIIEQLTAEPNPLFKLARIITEQSEPSTD